MPRTRSPSASLPAAMKRASGDQPIDAQAGKSETALSAPPSADITRICAERPLPALKNAISCPFGDQAGA